ncbi:ABC transporter substrate-binding protein [Gordonia sp. CPCC 205515]|uniref:ABC transporter substrate-binding protein n=1 Tax=Gordonia sp. CPCC 205515 TaxID=3140791 RepID=UPI003AF36312
MLSRLKVGSGAVALALAAAALAGCSDDAAGDSSSASPSVAYTGTPIKVMSITSTGTSTDFKTDTVAKAFVDKVNSTGGISGHKVDLVICDDKGDPNETANCGRQAVSEKVAAVVGGHTLNIDRALDYVDPAGIPYIGNLASSAKQMSSKVTYPIYPGPLALAAVATQAGSKCGDDIAVVAFDTPGVVGLLPVAEKALAKEGKKFSSSIKVAPTTVDFAGTAKAMGEHECNVTLLGSSQMASLVAAQAQLGVNTKMFTMGGTFDEKILSDFASTVNGSWTLSPFPSVDDPAWDQAKSALPEDFDFGNPITQNTWVSFVVLQKVLEGTSGDVTAATVLDAMNQATAVDTGGLTKPINFSKGLPLPGMSRIFNPVVVNFEIKDGKLVQDGGFVDLRTLAS